MHLLVRSNAEQTTLLPVGMPIEGISVKQADLDSDRRTDGATTDMLEENARLRRRIKQLDVGRDILSKATAWFAREIDSIPSKASNS